MKPGYTYFDLMTDIANASARGDSFARIPEPHSVTDGAANVEQYNQILETNITVNYSLTLDLIHRTRPERSAEDGGRAIDLCPGPGHLSLCIAEFLNYSSLVGVDFSEPMVKVANENARENAKTSKSKTTASFVQGDAKKLSFPPRKFDLLTFTNAAHHFDTIGEVEGILQSAEKIVKSDGLIVLTDLARLPDPELTQSFVTMASQDYVARGMKEMAQDFANSMMAAFTPQEMKQAVPRSTERVWFHLVTGGLPFFQALVGLPVGRANLFMREGRDWSQSGLLRTEAAKAEWEMLRGALYSGVQEQIRNRKAA